MRLIVKRGDNVVSESRFSRGPIYIGRQIGSQIFLPDRAVSRQHTVLYTTTEGKWVVEDLDSANRTYLNNEAIHKAGIKSGDVLKIADFLIEIQMEEGGKQDTTVHLDETLHSTLHETQVVVRLLEGADVPPVKLQAKRSKDFSHAAVTICKSRGVSGLVTSLVDLLFQQFGALNVWVAVRRNPAGAMEMSRGRKSTGQVAKPEEMPLASKISEAVKNRHYVLIPRLAEQEEGEKINSAVIAPVMCEGECFGVLYADNSPDHEHYNLEDLDYLILISLMTGAYIKNLP